LISALGGIKADGRKAEGKRGRRKLEEKRRGRGGEEKWKGEGKVEGRGSRTIQAQIMSPNSFHSSFSLPSPHFILHSPFPTTILHSFFPSSSQRWESLAYGSSFESKATKQMYTIFPTHSLPIPAPTSLSASTFLLRFTLPLAVIRIQLGSAVVNLSHLFKHSF
jgi:hypothetical protein